MPLLNTKHRLAILQAVATLTPLDGWEPVGIILEDVKLLLHGEEGITTRDYARLMEWASIWRNLDPRLHALYCLNLDRTAHVCVFAGLSAVMFGKTAPTGATYAYLQNLWEDLFGYPPSIELAPRPVHRLLPKETT